MDEITMLKGQIEKLEAEKRAAENSADALSRILNQMAKEKDSNKKDSSALLEENNRLKAENASLKEELAFIKRGRTTTKAIDTRIDNMNRSTVRIICMSINGVKMQDILKRLRISSSTYYRVISGKTLSDSQHMKDLYTQYKDLFDWYSVGEKDYKEWVSKRRAYLGKGYIEDEFLQ